MRKWLRAVPLTAISLAVSLILTGCDTSILNFLGSGISECEKNHYGYVKFKNASKTRKGYDIRMGDLSFTLGADSNGNVSETADTRMDVGTYNVFFYFAGTTTLACTKSNQTVEECVYHNYSCDA